MGACFSNSNNTNQGSTQTGGGVVGGDVDSVDWYQFFAQVIADKAEDADDYIAIIRKRTTDELKPKDSKSLPLLVLAKNRPKWFSQLIEDGRCDPNVKWEENGVTMTLKKVLLRQRAEEEGNEVYKIHRASMRRLKAAVAQPERNNDVPMEADYKAELDIMGIGLVVASGAAAAGAAAAAGVATMGGVLPLSAVGSALWEAIKRWHTSFNASKPTPELTELFTRNAAALGEIITQLDARIEAAKKAARSKDPALVYKYKEETRRVDTLRYLLVKHAAKDVAAIEKNRDISVETKREQLVDMLDKLHVHQERLFVLDRLDKIDAGLDESKYGASAHGLPRMDSSVTQASDSTLQSPGRGGTAESKGETIYPGT